MALAYIAVNALAPRCCRTMLACFRGGQGCRCSAGRERSCIGGRTGGESDGSIVCASASLPLRWHSSGKDAHPCGQNAIRVKNIKPAERHRCRVKNAVRLRA